MSEYKVLLEGRFGMFGLHSLYYEMSRYPPKGFKFIIPKGMRRGILTRYINRSLSVKSMITCRLLQHIRPLIAIYGERFLNAKRKLADIDLTFCVQHLNFRKEPWIVDLEIISALTGYGPIAPYRKSLEKILSSKYCKAILPYSEMSYKSIIHNINCRNIKDKIHLIRLASIPKNVQKKDDEVVKILFVGTGNPFNTSYSFEHKGGHYLLEAYAKIAEKYDNVELTIRSYVPSYLKSKFQKLKNVKIIDTYIPREELDNLFRSSDIFFHTTFETVNPSVIEAMSYGLCIIAFDVYDYPEIIEDWRNGLLVSKPRHLRYYSEPFIPNNYTNHFYKSMLKIDKNSLNELVEKLCLLIEDRSLRLKLSRNAYSEVVSGKLSLSSRNAKLREVLELALNK